MISNFINLIKYNRKNKLKLGPFKGLKIFPSNTSRCSTETLVWSRACNYIWFSREEAHTISPLGKQIQ